MPKGPVKQPNWRSSRKLPRFNFPLLSPSISGKKRERKGKKKRERGGGYNLEPGLSIQIMEGMGAKKGDQI